MLDISVKGIIFKIFKLLDIYNSRSNPEKKLFSGRFITQFFVFLANSLRFELIYYLTQSKQNNIQIEAPMRSHVSTQYLFWVSSPSIFIFVIILVFKSFITSLMLRGISLSCRIFDISCSYTRHNVFVRSISIRMLLLLIRPLFNYLVKSFLLLVNFEVGLYFFVFYFREEFLSMIHIQFPGSSEGTVSA